MGTTKRQNVSLLKGGWALPRLNIIAIVSPSNQQKLSISPPSLQFQFKPLLLSYHMGGLGFSQNWKKKNKLPLPPWENKQVSYKTLLGLKIFQAEIVHPKGSKILYWRQTS
jgi:hypothetical protein